MAKSKENQPGLPGIPNVPQSANIYRVNYQYKGNKNSLRAGALIINAATAEQAKDIANAQLKDDHQDWYAITSIKGVVTMVTPEVPF